MHYLDKESQWKGGGGVEGLGFRVKMQDLV
jgi:hypothetical protein